MPRPSLAARRRRALLAGTATLAALLIGIGASVVVDRRTAAELDVPLVPEPPSRIVIARPGFADIVLVHGDEDAWRIEAPCSLAASSARVAPLLEALEAARAARDAADVDLAGAGLMPPVATLTVDERTLDIGGPDLSGARRYLLAGDAVGFAPEWLGSLVGGGMTAFAGPGVVDGIVHVVDGEPGLANAWSALGAVQTVEWPVADMPAVLGERRVTLELKDGREVELDITSTAAWHAIRTEGAACARIVGVGDLPG